MIGCKKCPVTPSVVDTAHKVVTGHDPRCPERGKAKPLDSLRLLELLMDEVVRLRRKGIRIEGTVR